MNENEKIILPDEAYFKPMTLEEKLAVDKKLEATLDSIPTTPGFYLDNTGHKWTLNADGT